MRNVYNVTFNKLIFLILMFHQTLVNLKWIEELNIENKSREMFI